VKLQHCFRSSTRPTMRRMSFPSIWRLAWSLVVGLAVTWASTPIARAAEPMGSAARDDDSADLWGYHPSGFGAVGSVGLGFPDGDDAGPQQSVYGPNFALALNLELSFAFIYVGGGFTHLQFDDKDPLRSDLVNVETGDEIDSESSATAAMFSGEIGLAHGFGLGKWFAVRPGIGFGVSSDGEVNRDVANCVDCGRHVVLEKYKGGRYFRTHIGGYIRMPGIGGGFGIIASYQQFLGEVDQPALNRTILFGFAFAGGGGI